MLLLPRYTPLEEEPNSKIRVISLYRDIEKTLLDFNQDLRNELHNSNPDFIKDLQRRREDIEKTEICILIAGIAKLCVVINSYIILKLNLLDCCTYMYSTCFIMYVCFSAKKSHLNLLF